MIANIRNSISIARAGARRLSVIYVAVLVMWVMLESGIPLAPWLGQSIDGTVWGRTLADLIFVFALGWLLFLLLSKGLKLIAEAQDALQLLERASESTVNAVIISEYGSSSHPIVYANPAFERITGLSRDDVLGQDLFSLPCIEASEAEKETLREALQAQRPGRAVLGSRRNNGSACAIEVHVAPVRNEAGAMTHFVTVLDDITEMRRYQEELERQANYDTLTDLANRNLFADRVEHALSRARRNGTGFTLVQIGLDKFSRINDSHGHSIGNGLLRAVAERLQKRFRAVDTIARPGGDEFALILVDQGRGLEVAGQIQRIMDTFDAPFVVEGRDLFVNVSVGLAQFPQDGESAEILLKRAEIAMHRAKDHEGNTFQLFTSEMDARVADRVALENDLRRAIERDEFIQYYQPRIDLASGRIHGAEALLRWRHPQRGLVSPALFIPLAEETGQANAIGDWVLRTACRQAKDWLNAGLPPITMAVNVSALQFRQEDLARTVGAVLGEVGLAARSLELELTESAVMHDADRVIEILHKLKAMGIRLAIDDFGTGYSSLSYLKRMPVDNVKIDQSFVRDMEANIGSAAIVQAVIALGRSLGLRVVAEGVETEQQRDFLADHGCDEIQGYLTGKPMPAPEFAELLGKQAATKG